MSFDWVYDNCTPLDRSVVSTCLLGIVAALQLCVVCLHVFGPCVPTCLYTVNVPLRVVCLVMKPAGFANTPK